MVLAAQILTLTWECFDLNLALCVQGIDAAKSVAFFDTC